jgi:hypothetical protein
VPSAVRSAVRYSAAAPALALPHPTSIQLRSKRRPPNDVLQVVLKVEKD